MWYITTTLYWILNGWTFGALQNSVYATQNMCIAHNITVRASLDDSSLFILFVCNAYDNSVIRTSYTLWVLYSHEQRDRKLELSLAAPNTSSNLILRQSSWLADITKLPDTIKSIVYSIYCSRAKRNKVRVFYCHYHQFDYGLCLFEKLKEPLCCLQAEALLHYAWVCYLYPFSMQSTEHYCNFIADWSEPAQWKFDAPPESRMNGKKYDHIQSCTIGVTQCSHLVFLNTFSSV